MANTVNIYIFVNIVQLFVIILWKFFSIKFVHSSLSLPKIACSILLYPKLFIILQ